MELDRDPHLYSDGNIIEVCCERCIPWRYLIENVGSGLGHRVFNPHSTVLRSDGWGINPHGLES